ncbi:purine-nucleoside phosphorylase [Candidatus Beckwithbacteria bacterium]|nr:purine-nucleoside phosphorylase [Candidatus Beckwithbacteria bacterium]
MNKSIFQVEQIIKNLSSFQDKIQTLLVLGSGWNKVIENMAIEKTFIFEKIFGAGAGVLGHRGELFLTKMGQKYFWIMAGRFHTYEGFSSEEVTRPIQAFAKLGVKNVILTSASGALNERYKVGDIVVLSDVLTLLCQSPLNGASFQDMSAPFDKDLRKIAVKICQSNQIEYQEGIYVYCKGPHFESFADKKALKILGADCVGMSTVPETIMANFLGLKVLGLSCVTNLAFVKHDHQEVLANAKKEGNDMKLLLTQILQNC